MIHQTTPVALVVLFLGVACSAQAQVSDGIWAPAWEWTDVDASIRFTGVGLGDVSEEIHSSAEASVSQSFYKWIKGFADVVQPGGHTNQGAWHVSQESTFTDTGLSTSMMQMAQTSTDGGAVGAFLESRLDVAFQVNSPIAITLEGTTEGNPNPGSSNFSRVLLQQGNQILFRSPGGDFAFEQMLQPGHTYSLHTRVAGESNLTNTTESAAMISLKNVIVSTIKSFDIYGDALYVTNTGPNGAELSILRPGQPLENYRLQPNGQTVSSQIHTGPDGFAIVSRDPGSPSDVTVSYSSHDQYCACDAGFTCGSGLSGTAPSLFLNDGVPCRATTTVKINGAGTRTFESFDAMISPSDPATGLPTGERFGAALVEVDGQPALVDWQWGEDATHTTIDEPRVTVLSIMEPTAITVLDFIDGPADQTVGAFASASGVTLVAFGNLLNPDLLNPDLLNPDLLASLDAGGVPFDPSTLRAGTSAAGNPAVSIQQGNSLRLYEYNGVSLEMVAEQELLAGATGFFHPNNTELIIKLQGNQLLRGRLGEAVRQEIAMEDLEIAHDGLTPSDSPTSHVSLTGNAVVTVDASYVAPPGTDRIEAIAARDAVVIRDITTGAITPPNYRLHATGNRAAVVAKGSVAGGATSHGREVARTIVLSTPAFDMPGDTFDDAFADDTIETVSADALLRMRESLGVQGDESVSALIDALVVSDSPGGTQGATVQAGFQLPYDPITLPFRSSSVIETTDGGGTILRATAPQRDDPFLAFNSLAAAVTPEAYLFASNDANSPAAQGLAQAAADVLDHPLGQLDVLAWENLHLQTNADNPTMQAEFISGVATVPNVETDTLVSVENFVGWDKTVSGSDEGTMLVELGIVTENAHPDQLETIAAISGSPAEVANALAGQLYALPEKDDEVLIVFLRFELTAPPQGTAWFNNAAGLIQLLPAFVEGDYNGNGTVEQGDLDLALLNWGTEVADLAAVGWVSDLPSGAIDQEELDKVLLNWGRSVSTPGAAGVPEPTTWVLAGLAILCSLQPLKRHAAVNRQDRAGRVR